MFLSFRQKKVEAAKSSNENALQNKQVITRFDAPGGLMCVSVCVCVCVWFVFRCAIN